MEIDTNFELPFEWPESSEYHDDQEEYDRARHMEALQKSIPKTAKFVGLFTNETEGFCITWISEDYYYLIPLGDDWDFGLFRITWDDNWGRFGMEACNRIKGCTDRAKAEQAMLENLFKSWNVLENENSEDGAFHQFLRDR